MFLGFDVVAVVVVVVVCSAASSSIGDDLRRRLLRCARHRCKSEKPALAFVERTEVSRTRSRPTAMPLVMMTQSEKDKLVVSAPQKNDDK